MKTNWKFVRFDSNNRVEPNFQKLEFVRNSFDLIWKLAIQLIRKVKKFKKIDKNQFEISSIRHHPYIEFTDFNFEYESNSEISSFDMFHLALHGLVTSQSIDS